jgi:hypothetical protein
MGFVERTWERRHADGMRERIIQTTEVWCEGFIVDSGLRERAGRGTSRDSTGFVMRQHLVRRGHECSVLCDAEWHELPNLSH